MAAASAAIDARSALSQIANARKDSSSARFVLDAPADKLTQLGRAQHALLHGEVALALDAFKELVEASPDDMHLQERFAGMLVEVGEIESARLTYRMVARHWEALGFQLRAVKIWRKLVELSPLDLNARRHLGELYVSLHFFDLARQVYLQLAETFAVQGNYRRRLAMLEAILKFSPEDLELRLTLMRELGSLGLDAESREHLEIVCDALYELRDWARLLPHLRRLVEIVPDDVDRIAQLAEAESELQSSNISESAMRRVKASTAEGVGARVATTSEHPLVHETTARRLEKGEVPAFVLEAFDEGDLDSLFAEVDAKIGTGGHDASMFIGLDEVTGEGGHSIIRKLAELEGLQRPPSPPEEEVVSADEVLQSVHTVIDTARIQTLLEPPPMGVPSPFGRRPFGPCSEVLLSDPGHVVAAAIRARHRGDEVLALALLEDEAVRSYPAAASYERGLALATRQQWKEAAEVFKELLDSADLAPTDEALVAYQIALVSEVLSSTETACAYFEFALALVPDEAEELNARIARLRA